MHLLDSIPNDDRLHTFKWIDCLAFPQHGQRLGVKELVVAVNVLEVFPQGPEGEVGVTYPGLGAVRGPADKIHFSKNSQGERKHQTKKVKQRMDLNYSKHK